MYFCVYHSLVQFWTQVCVCPCMHVCVFTCVHVSYCFYFIFIFCFVQLHLRERERQSIKLGNEGTGDNTGIDWGNSKDYQKIHCIKFLSTLTKTEKFNAFRRCLITKKKKCCKSQKVIHQKRGAYSETIKRKIFLDNVWIIIYIYYNNCIYIIITLIIYTQ